MNIVDIFKNNGIAVNCKTEQQAKLFITICHNHGLSWRFRGEDICYNQLITFWSSYGSRTVYAYNYCNFGHLTYGKLGGILEYSGYEVMSFSDFMNEYYKEFGNFVNIGMMV